MSGVGLLERSEELEAISEVLRRADAGTGSLLMLEGESGIGKTALLDRACRQAQDAAMAILSARGGPLERAFPFGIVRQLFDGILHGMNADQRAALLQGPARLATSLLDPGLVAPGASGTIDPSFALLHGLYWLTLDLAGAEPLLIVIDDAQWADPASLRFLMHLGRRLDGIAVAVLLATQPVDGSAGALLSQIANDALARRLDPPPLQEDGVAQILREQLGAQPDERLVVACLEATGGNPFFIHEVAGALAEQRMRPTAAAARAVMSTGPRAVADRLLRRLTAEPTSFTALARATAVLDDRGDLELAASIAEIDHSEARRAADGLTALGVLAPGPGLSFRHTVVQSAVYESLSGAERTAAHLRAAALLRTRGERVERVAAHILAAEPPVDPGAFASLRAAAAQSLALGVPENAVVYLSRALREPLGREARAELLCELGTAGRLSRDPAAIEHLREALRLSAAPPLRARLILQLIMIQGYTDEHDLAIELIDSALSELGDSHPELTLQLQAAWTSARTADPRIRPELDRRLASVARTAELAGDKGRDLRLLLTLVATHGGAPPQSVLERIKEGLAGWLVDVGLESWGLPAALESLIAIDELDVAASLSQEILDAATARGSLFGLALGTAGRAFVAARRGDLPTAESDLRAAVALTSEHGVILGLIMTLGYGVEALVERTELSDMAQLAFELEPPPALGAGWAGAVHAEVRGRLQRAQGNLGAARESLRMAAAVYDALHVRNPLVSSWRSELALVSDDPLEARRLTEDELADAREIGLPRGIGVATRALGVLEGGTAGIERLREAAEILDRSPSALEQARARVELGAALRRGNRRSEARDQLRTGADLAHRCGATRLLARAVSELEIAGARPRRLALTGRNALTPSEVRVASLAAGGRTNREIAQTLFVTPKTVENQLGHVYRKLDIGSRGQLANALTRPV